MGVSTPASVWRRVVQEERTQGQDADGAQRGRYQDGEDRQGEDLPAHLHPLLPPVLDAVVKEDGAQGGSRNIPIETDSCRY